MSAAQVARDLRFVATDLGCALVQVSVVGVAAVGSWVARRRQTVVSDQWERHLARLRAIEDQERLAEAEADREVWAPQELGACQDCGHGAERHYRAGGLIDPCADCDCLDLFAPRSVHPVDAKHHGGHRFSIGPDGVGVEPIPGYERPLCEAHDHPDPKPCVACCYVCNAPCDCSCGCGSSSAQHPSAGRAGGPEAVSGQPPASGNPNAAGELLDHIESLIYEHEMFPRVESRGVECLGAGCTWVGPHRLAHSAHVAELISAMVAADTRVGNALKGTR